MVDIQSPTAEIRRGKKERKTDRRRRRKKAQGKNIMACPIPYGGHKKLNLTQIKCNTIQPQEREV